MTPNETMVIYWDTSAVISSLFEDEHSKKVIKYANAGHVHLISTLTIAETHAVIARIKRENILADILIKAAIESLESGPWRQIYISPDYKEIKRLAGKWFLRGADLWHLATAVTLQKELPEIKFLTFDKNLSKAVQGENMLPDNKN